MTISRFLLTCCLLVGASLHSSAQSDSLLLGDWFYNAPMESEKVDAQGREMLDRMFGEMTFSFREDGTYSANALGKEDTGTWSMNRKQTELILTPVNGPASTLRVLLLTAEEWRMELREGKGFIMTREALPKP